MRITIVTILVVFLPLSAMAADCNLLRFGALHTSLFTSTDPAVSRKLTFGVVGPDGRFEAILQPKLVRAKGKAVSTGPDTCSIEFTFPSRETYTGAVLFFPKGYFIAGTYGTPPLTVLDPPAARRPFYIRAENLELAKP